MSIVLMIMHQCFAYAMFIMPVHHMWEKAIGTHDKPHWIRLPSRIPVGTQQYLFDTSDTLTSPLEMLEESVRITRTHWTSYLSDY